jgi:Ca2+-binding EF-hand superfamily protein
LHLFRSFAENGRITRKRLEGLLREMGLVSSEAERKIMFELVRPDGGDILFEDFKRLLAIIK